MLERPAFLQGMYCTNGRGTGVPVQLAPRATYRVPSDRRAQTVYFRAGNACSELITLVLVRDGAVMRYFPIGARSAMHVALAVNEDISPDTTLEVLLAAPDGLLVPVVLDVGFMELSS